MSITSIYTDGSALERGRAFAIIFDRFLSNKAIEFKCAQDEGRVAGYAHAYFDDIIYNSHICDESSCQRAFRISRLITTESYNPFIIDRDISSIRVHSSFQIPKKEAERKHAHDQYKVIDLPPEIKTRGDLVKWMQRRNSSAIALMKEVVLAFSDDKLFQDAKSKVEAKLSLSVKEMACAYKKLEQAMVSLANVNQPREKGCAFHIVIILLGILLICLLNGK